MKIKNRIIQFFTRDVLSDPINKNSYNNKKEVYDDKEP